MDRGESRRDPVFFTGEILLPMGIGNIDEAVQQYCRSASAMLPMPIGNRIILVWKSAYPVIWDHPVYFSFPSFLPMNRRD
ncbi:hypothetical protein D0T51_02080 [Parabacteroides sp. 52]|nr:hypothetical protein [Parabacteroides sp. 52]